MRDHFVEDTLKSLSWISTNRRGEAARQVFLGLLKAFGALALVFASVQVLAAGRPDPDGFRLTPALLDKMEALQAASGVVDKATDDLEAESVQDLARSLEADPRIRSLLAKHGITSMEYSLGAFAALHAGMFIAMASTISTKQQATAMSAFTPAQRANIELMRKRLRP